MNLSTFDVSPLPAPARNPSTNVESISEFPDLISEQTTKTTPFALACWPNSYTTDTAEITTMLLPELAEHLAEQGLIVCPKPQAEILGFFTTSDGRRSDASVTSISAVALDCDGTGSWDRLKETLDRQNIGYILYQSSSYTPEKPKWRCILVLDHPFKVNEPKDRAAWTALYRYISEVVGGVAGLTGKGFDGSTVNVSRIWYVGPRPDRSAPSRVTVWRDGRCLSLEKLRLATPIASSEVWAAPAGEFKLSLAGLAFNMCGMVGKSLGETKFAVKCPRDSEHSLPIGDGAPDSSTVIFSANNFGGFKCQHGHSNPNPKLPPIAEPFGLKHALDVLEHLHPGVLLKARAMQEKANTGGSAVERAYSGLQEAKRVAKKAHREALDYTQLAKNDLATVADQAKAAALLDRAKKLEAEAVAAEEKFEVLTELMRDTSVVFKSSDDLDIAERIIEDWGEEYCVFDQGSFYRYLPEAGIWTPKSKRELEHRVTQYKNALARGPKGLAPVSWNAGKLAGVAHTLSTMCPDTGFFDEKPPAVCFKNGVLRILENGHGPKTEFVAHDPNFRQRYALPVNYGGPVAAPVWDRFLNDVLEANEQTLLHEFLGACLMEDATRYQHAVMLVGYGRNGKSSLLDTVRQMFPPEAQAALAPALWGHRFQATRLIAKAINICDEVPNARITESDVFKKIVTGGTMESEFKGQDLFSFKPMAGHIFAANELPHTSDNSDGFYRRWIIINMDRQIALDKIDVDIGERLKADVPGIISRCIEAYLQLRARGKYNLPESSLEARAEWQAENDHVLRFLRTYCEKGDKEDWKSVEDIHRKYKQVATQEGVAINDQVSTIAIGRALGRNEFRPVNRAQGGGRGWLVKFKPLAGIGNSPFPRN